jgi:hypothetical protein
MTRALILAAVVVALVSPIAVQARSSAARPQTQAAPMRWRSTPDLRLPAMNHAPNVTLKRGAISG